MPKTVLLGTREFGAIRSHQISLCIGETKVSVVNRRSLEAGVFCDLNIVPVTWSAFTSRDRCRRRQSASPSAAKPARPVQVEGSGIAEVKVAGLIRIHPGAATAPGQRSQRARGGIVMVAWIGGSPLTGAQSWPAIHGQK